MASLVFALQRHIMLLSTDHYLERAEAQRHHIHQQLISLVGLLTKTSELMASELRQGAPRGKWIEYVINALIDYLHAHRSEGSQGGKFKDTTYNAAAAHLQPLLAGGKLKDGKSVKGKWGQVSKTYSDLTNQTNLAL